MLENKEEKKKRRRGRDTMVVRENANLKEVENVVEVDCFIHRIHMFIFHIIIWYRWHHIIRYWIIICEMIILISSFYSESIFYNNHFILYRYNITILLYNILSATYDKNDKILFCIIVSTNNTNILLMIITIVIV